MLKQLIKKTAYSIAPKFTAKVDDRWWLQKNARDLMRRAADCRSADDYLQALRNTNGFPAWQNRGEILGLMNAISQLQPRQACEIGSMEGGTLFLLTQMCHPDAHVISIDRSYTAARRSTFPKFARHRQRVTLLEADSHSPTTRRQLEHTLEGQRLDFLFIDGDHSYSGVYNDFEMYAPLVRPGGIIAFHDIVPDNRARGLDASLRDSGGVPKFWEHIRGHYDNATEFIDDRDQDGCGIGMIRWPGRRTAKL